jgi:selenocysteine-specific elongation factor
MQVVATAGHVDHGKSTLVRALTGMEPDRWAEERRRGMTIDLGFAWTVLSGGETVAFVDVPGHERFVPNMLAGVGPVPAALLVIAADGGWMPQTAEHVAALDALGVRHGLVAVTRSDLADPGPVLAEMPDRLGGTSLRAAAAVAVSATTGAGLPELRAALGRLVRELPAPDPDASLRLWIDRAFTIRGSGTVVTGTLGAGTLSVGDELVLFGSQFGSHGPRPVRVRGLQALGRPAERLSAVARAAVNLRGVDRHEVARGDALLAPGTWTGVTQLDAQLDLGSQVEPNRLPSDLVLHLGSAAVGVRLRPLGPLEPTGSKSPATEAGSSKTPAIVRLTLNRPLPIAAGDRALLRDPGGHVIVGRVTVLDIDPPVLTRRGAAARRAAELARPASGEALLRRHGTLRSAVLAATGTAVPPGAVPAGDWLVHPELAESWRQALADLVERHRRSGSLEPGPTVDSARTALGAPDRAIVTALVKPPLAVRDGRLIDLTAAPALPPAIAGAVGALLAELRERPFSAPDAARLADLRLGPRELAAAQRAGALLRVADGIVLAPDADVRAARLLAELPQPFTLSQARQRLGTTRRVAVPLLELMDRRRITVRQPDDRRSVRPPDRRAP